MAMQKRRVRYPMRITFQMSEELHARLLEVADRDHGGDLQALGRQCLQARVDGSGVGTDQLAELMQTLEGLRAEVVGRTRESAVRMDDLLDVITQMHSTLSSDRTETMATRDKVDKLAEDVTRQSRDLIRLMATQNNTGELVSEIARQNCGIAEMLAAINKPEARQPEPRKRRFFG